jgi:putative phosphoesterase
MLSTVRRLLVSMRIGIVSDTHGYFDPHLTRLLHGVDEILHAGDVGSEAVLDKLRALAPVQAVRGNVDSAALGLPPTFTKSFGGLQTYMLHELPKSQSAIRDWAQAAPLEGKAAEHCRRFLESCPEDCRVVIFGHSHEPCALVLGSKLFFNPGSAGKKRFSLPRCCGVLEISTEGVNATFLGLERYNEDLPESVYLPTGGAKACGN